MPRRSSAEIAAELEAAEDATVALAARDKAESAKHLKKAADLGIEDNVSSAVRILASKYAYSPLTYLYSIMNDEQASKSSRAAAAFGLLPYIHGRPIVTPPKAHRYGVSGVMEVPMAESMEKWMGIAARSQAQLKEVVRH